MPPSSPSTTWTGTASSTRICGARFFTTPAETAVAKLIYAAIQELQRDPALAPDVAHVATPAAQARLVQEVTAEYRAGQLGLEGVASEVDIAAVVAKTASLVVDQTISIPRITVVPTGQVRSGFHPFALNLAGLTYQPVADELWTQLLRTGEGETIGLGAGGAREARPEDYVVSGLIDYDDVAYDANAGLLYDLAAQTVRHLRGYLSAEDAEKVLRVHGRDIARFVHAQMQDHAWEEAAGFETKVNSGFSTIRSSSYNQAVPTSDFRFAPADKSNMARYLFGGFRRCLHPVQKFQSDAERLLAIILDRDAQKWFKPASGLFQITYRLGPDHHEYQPDFVAELDDRIAMLEPKARNQMEAPDVAAKRDAAVAWCERATAHAVTSGGKPWAYALIPHDAVAENSSLDHLLGRWTTVVGCQ